MSPWDLRATGSLKAHSLLLAASMTVKWCRATGVPEMSKNIPLQPCCWTCQVCCQLGNSLSLEEVFLEIVRSEVLTRKSNNSQMIFSIKIISTQIQKTPSYSVILLLWNKLLTLLFSILSTQNSAKLRHRAGSTQYPKACATSSNLPANLLKAWKGRCYSSMSCCILFYTLTLFF